jgi:hypothetical protein
MTPTYEYAKLWFADPVNARNFFGNFEIHENGCQLWKGPFFDSGHGLYTFDGGHVRVHRLRWIMRRGVDLPDDICIRHFMCAKKACGNPAHLIGGDWNDNWEDQVWLDGVPMAFGAGFETGGEPGSLRRTQQAKPVHSLHSESRAAKTNVPEQDSGSTEGEIEI